jgi:hypothetical protein
MRLERQGPQVLEPRFVARDRRTERSKACGQNFDAIEIGTRFFERTIQFAFDPIDCRIRCHNNTTRTFCIEVRRMSGDGSYFRRIDRNSINKT